MEGLVRFSFRQMLNIPLLYLSFGIAKEFTPDEISKPSAYDIKAGGSSSQHKPWGPARPGAHLLEQHPRLIQRMESGYESSERNSSSPISLDAAPPESLNVYRYYLVF